MTDAIFEGFLDRQCQDALALTRDSDLVQVLPLPSRRGRFRAWFRCKGLVQAADESIVEADRFEVGIWFPSNYLRTANTYDVLTWLGPAEVFHPNISDIVPFICIGRLTRGTPLVEIVYRLFDLITYNNVTMVEREALNHSACVWARANRHRFPIDRRPLKRRTLNLTVQSATFELQSSKTESD